MKIITALILVIVLFAVVVPVLYFINRGISMTGFGEIAGELLNGDTTGYGDTDVSDGAAANSDIESEANNENNENPEFERIIYKTVGERKLVIEKYEPSRKLFSKNPVVVYIHGGSWSGGTHELSGDDFKEIINPLREYGITLISVEYRLTDENTVFPAHIEDVTDAVRFIVKNADEYGIDPDRICLLGGSAGAHLSLLAALAPDEFIGSYSNPYKIRCVVALSAPLNFTDLSCYTGDDLTAVKGLLWEFLGCTYEENPALYEKASPSSYIGKSSLPILLMHGEKDRVVPIVQADSFYEKAVAAQMNITYIRVLNGDHGLGSDDGNPTSPETSEIIKSMVSFLVRNLLI